MPPRTKFGVVKQGYVLAIWSIAVKPVHCPGTSEVGQVSEAPNLCLPLQGSMEGRNPGHQRFI